MDAGGEAVASVDLQKALGTGASERDRGRSYAEGTRLGLSRHEVCRVSNWVLSQAAM